MGYFQRDDLPFGTYGSRAAGSEDRWQVGVTVPVGKDYIRASYVRTDSRKGPVGYNQSDANKYAIGYVHNMSTRTAVYGTIARITNKRSEEHTSELQSPCNLVCRLLLEKKNTHMRH